LVGIDGAGNIPVGGDDAIDRPPRRGTGAGKIGLFGTRHASTPLDCAQALHARREDREFSTENISQTPEDVNEISSRSRPGEASAQGGKRTTGDMKIRKDRAGFTGKGFLL
jgi:hypothetical protein